MEIKLVEYGSLAYEDMVALRSSVLRAPLGMTFTASDLEADKDNVLIGCYDSDILVGCCILTSVNRNTLQLRQMAVDSNSRGRGVGTELLSFAEDYTRRNGHRFVYLHARKVAVNFYTKHGYMLESDEFIEVGIPHFEMLKNVE